MERVKWRELKWNIFTERTLIVCKYVISFFLLQSRKLLRHSLVKVNEQKIEKYSYNTFILSYYLWYTCYIILMLYI